MDDKPSMIILDTIKGKGFSKAENTEMNHSISMSAEDYKLAVQEIQEFLAESKTY